MKLVSSLFIAFGITLISLVPVQANEKEYDYHKVEQELLRSESELRTKLAKGASYIRQLGAILPALQSDEEQLHKIFTRMEMLKSPERFEKMSLSVQILIDYIYYKILFLQMEPEMVENSNTPELQKAGAVTLGNFPLYTGGWREDLDIKISQMGFSTLYFNAETGKISHPITLKDMSLSGSGMIQDIAPPEDAGVYIAGYIHIETAGGYSFSLTQSGGEAELILDERRILEVTEDAEISVYLESGSYLLELQYENNAEILEVEVEFGE